MFRKFATAAILDAQMGADAGFSKSAHRAVFNYAPREGYLYVRSRAISSRCNDNFDMFPAGEIESAYKSFLGKPVFVNHYNDDHRRARGVIIDAALHKDINPDGSPDTWVELLHEVDAVKFPKLAKAILAKEVNRTSMGCDVQFSKCSVCHNVATSPLEYCAHIPGKKGKRIYRVDPSTGKKEGTLVFEVCSGLSFFENSLLVEQPADPTAYFLGEVESGGGLDHLKASITTTASVREIPQWNKKSLTSQMQRTASLRPTQNVWNLLKQAADADASQSAVRPTEKSNRVSNVWSLIREATLIGDDLYDTDFDDFRFTAAGNAPDYNADQFFRQNQPHPANLVHLFHQAADQGYFKKQAGADIPKMGDHAFQSGMSWYNDMHHVTRALAGAAHHNLGLDQNGNHSHALTHNKVVGATAVYSEGTDVPMNYHQASLATRMGKGLSSKNTHLDPDSQSIEFGTVKNPKTKEYDPGKPKSTDSQESKVNTIFHPGTTHFNQVVKAPKTSNYGHLALTGGDTPDTDHEDMMSHNGPKRRVVVDRHASSAMIGRRIDGTEFGQLGLSNYPGSVKNPLAHQEGKFGTDANKHYSLAADSYRVAADHLSRVYKTPIAPHQVQAVTWGVQRHLNEQGDKSGTNPLRGKAPKSWKPEDEKTWQGIVSHKHSWLNEGEKGNTITPPKFTRSQDNSRNTNNWENHVDRHDIKGPIREHFNGPEGGTGHWGSKRQQGSPNFSKAAYGETKAPQDVDTLRAENCTVCGNSSAFDGKQCQVCGYVAPPKAFGDPNTDVARDNDLRKQVLDGDQADPMDTDQPMGNQQGNPDELDEQQADAEAGEDTQLPMLTCQNCGTGVQPALPASAGGEPPYPADGDACPVCKKGQLLSGAEEGAEEGEDPAEGDNQDLDGDGIPDKDEDEDEDGVPDDQEESDEDEPEQDDEDEDLPPKKKKDD